MEIFYGGDVRFKTAGGELVDYDPTLVPLVSETSINGTSLEGYAYENKEGDKKQYLPENLSEITPVKMEKEGYSISFYPIRESPYEEISVMNEEFSKEEVVQENIQPYGKSSRELEKSEENLEIDNENNSDIFQPVMIENMEITDLYGEESLQPLKAVYENKEQSYQLKYESSDIGVKESIVLNELPQNNKFSFEFKLEGMKIRKNPTSHYPSIPISANLHKEITKRWRRAIPYRNHMKAPEKISKKILLEHCEEIYGDMPELKIIAKDIIKKYAMNEVVYKTAKKIK